MSRHSKWAKIKRQKAVTDVRRGQVFTKILRAITVAAQEGGGDPATNVRLRMAMDRATAENMPKENIQRAIDRAVGADGESAMESLTLEGYGPGGAALLIDAVTDNRNRTVGEIRRTIQEHGGSLGGAGSTQWMFERRGHWTLTSVTDADQAELAAIDAGAAETERGETTLDILTKPEALHAVKVALEVKGFHPEGGALILVAKNPLPLSAATLTKVQELVESLAEHTDVVEVTTNAVPQ